MHKRVSYSIKLWSLLWTSWAFALLMAITLIFAMHKFAPYSNPPHIYIVLLIIFFNGLVFSSFLGLPSLVDVNDYVSLTIAVLVGLVQWFFIYQLGRLWLLNWQNHRWYWKSVFPIFFIGYYAITGTLSICLLAIAVD